jgi:penicillin-binding protein 2
MRRRDVVPALLSLATGARASIRTGAEALGGCALLLNLRDGRMLVEGANTARQWMASPGSTIKPISLLALIEANKLAAEEEYFCPGRLVLNGRSLDCTHPYTGVPMNVSRAVAYSCNCAVAHFAQRFETGELARNLERAGLCSVTRLIRGEEDIGRVDALSAGPATQLQALGESGIAVTPLELLVAYKHLAMRALDRRVQPITEGLEGAVEFGTAQGARLDRVRVAGKTGSVVTVTGAHAAWFAGFAPSRAPVVATVVLVQGRSGGADAAPLAGRLLRDFFRGRA